MTKIKLTWQRDEQHDNAFDEEVSVLEPDLSSHHFLNKVESVVVVEEPTLPTRLHFLEASAISVILHDCIEQLSIIKFMVNETVFPSWTDLFQYQPMAERFKSTPKKKLQFQEEVYEKIPYTDHQKLQKDICFLINTLTEVCREITEKGDYTVLEVVLEGVRKQEEDNELLETRGISNAAELEVLKKCFRREKRKFTKELKAAEDCIGQFKNEIEDVYAYGKQELRYAEDWENARTYMNELQLTNAEDVHNHCISNHLTKIEYENTIHNEIRNFIQENSEDLQEDINFWMEHYDEEIERRDSEIIHLKMKWEELSEDHIALKNLYEEHTAFVIERRAINEERRRLEELFRVQTAAAIKIQALWRGTMVRKKLGPFRVKKGKKGKDKDKKGKGKKKKK